MGIHRKLRAVREIMSRDKIFPGTTVRSTPPGTTDPPRNCPNATVLLAAKQLLARGVGEPRASINHEALRYRWRYGVAMFSGVLVNIAVWIDVDLEAGDLLLDDITIVRVWVSDSSLHLSLALLECPVAAG